VFARRWRAKLSRGALPEIPEDVVKTRVTAGPGKSAGWVTAVRWTARVLGTLLFAIYTLFVLGEGLPPIGSLPEGVLLSFVAVGLILLGFLIGWKREGVAALLIASGWTLWHIADGRFRLDPFQTPLPVAVLYGLCWWASHGRRTVAVVRTVAALALVLMLGQLFVPTSVFVTGVIHDAATGSAIANAELTLPRSATFPSTKEKGPNARSGPHGLFTLYVGWYAEGKQVRVSAPGYETLTTNLGPRTLGQRRVSRDFRLLKTKASNPAAPAFGPVIERVLYSVAVQRPIKAEDLDKEREIEVPGEVEKAGEDKFFHWLATNGVDLLAFAHKQSWELWASPKLAGVSPAMWDRASSEELLRALTSGVMGLGRASLDVKDGFASYQVNENTVFPQTFAFRTGAGAVGLLQLTGTTEAPRGLKIRYKLAPPGAGTTPATQVEATPQRFVRLVVDKDAMTFEGQPTTWEEVGALLEKVMDRTNTVLECAVTSDQITVQQQNEWSMKSVLLARNYGFKYASFVGIKELGSAGTPVTGQSAAGVIRPPEFGPAIERELGGWPGLDVTVLDLDQGRLLTVPTNIVAASMNNPRPMLNWMMEHGADLTVTTGAGAHLHLDDGVLLRLVVKSASFDNVTASTIRRHIGRGGGAQDVSVSQTDLSAQPVYLYRTGEGGVGVLQVLGLAQDPHNLKIRFKAVLEGAR
jgi:hypothetical protein